VPDRQPLQAFPILQSLLFSLAAHPLRPRRTTTPFEPKLALRRESVPAFGESARCTLLNAATAAQTNAPSFFPRLHWTRDNLEQGMSLRVFHFAVRAP
jgi:hypothetical protein